MITDAFVVLVTTLALGSGTESADKPPGRALLGVQVHAVDAALAKDLGLKEAGGAYVADAPAKSPAAAGGMREGDVVLVFGAKKVLSPSDLAEAVRLSAAGSTVRVTVWRGRKERTLRVRLGRAAE